MPDKLQLTILVDGEPEPKSFPPHEKVEEVLKSLLPAGEKQDWGKWQLKLGAKLLEPASSLEANGVTSGATLAFTKKEGGGGCLG
jgi:hypothetical protein